MAEKRYGGNKTLYGVTVTDKGRIELRSYHKNKSMREVLTRYSSNPSHLLLFHDSYARSSIRAKYWLSKVMTDYRRYFEKGLVDIAVF